MRVNGDKLEPSALQAHDCTSRSTLDAMVGGMGCKAESFMCDITSGPYRHEAFHKIATLHMTHVLALFCAPALL